MKSHLIWSNEHNAWWAPNERGYTPIIANAGVYSRDRAVKICENAGLVKSLITGHYIPAELPISLADLPSDLVRQLPFYNKPETA